MKRLLLGMTLAFSLLNAPAHAQDYDLEVTDFAGSYASPEGSGAGKFQGDDFELSLLKKEDNTFVAGIFGTEFVLANPPQLLLDVETLDWSGISLGIGEENLYANIGSVGIVSPKSNIQLRNLALGCAIVQVDDELDMIAGILNSCLTGGTLDVTKLTIVSEVEEGDDDEGDESEKKKPLSVNAFVGTLLNQINETKTTEIEKLDLDIVDHAFKLKVKADVGIKATIKAEGRTNYNIEEQRIELRLDKAKASFFNIKDKVFEMIEGLDNPAVTVERPWIFLSLKKDDGGDNPEELH